MQNLHFVSKAGWELLQPHLRAGLREDANCQKSATKSLGKGGSLSSFDLVPNYIIGLDYEAIEVTMDGWFTMSMLVDDWAIRSICLMLDVFSFCRPGMVPRKWTSSQRCRVWVPCMGGAAATREMPCRHYIGVGSFRRRPTGGQRQVSRRGRDGSKLRDHVRPPERSKHFRCSQDVRV